jgi:Flp pilus assembly protein TadG
VEFALSLPFLVVIAIGVFDFGKAYNVKHILTNAGREGARMVVSNPLTNANCTDSTPCSIEAAADAVQQYLTGAGLSAASCITPNSPSSSGTLTWTYSCNSVTLTINRGYVFTATDGTAVSSTQVTLAYPYTWTFGNVIGLLVKNASISLPSSLTTSVVMQNLD